MTDTQNSKPMVFVVDDDRTLRESLVTLITALGYRTRGFESGVTFHEYYQASMPGCLVLDVRMPGLGGLELYERLVREGKRLPVIFITAHAEVSMAVAAMKTGAIEFIEKPFAHETLLACLQHALELDFLWRRREAEFARLDDKISRLNHRDHETLDLILAGAANKVMAERLGISQRAVEMRRATMMKKLDIESLAELLELAVTHRLLGEINTMRHQGLLR